MRGVPPKDKQYKKGQSGNPNGKPRGALSFKTKWFNFIDTIAKEQGVKPEDIDKDLLNVGLKKAKSGDYKFWQDIHDRVYGKPTQTIAGDKENPLTIQPILVEFLTKNNKKNK